MVIGEDYFLYRGNQLKQQIHEDYKEFGDASDSILSWYGSGYESIQEDKYYLVTGELTILQEYVKEELKDCGSNLACEYDGKWYVLQKEEA